MTGELVLITGSNGALGYPVVLHALRAGFRVRAVVRSPAKADMILDAPSVQALDPATKAKLTFAIVPDMLKEDAYTAALEGAVYAIHVASPIPTSAESLTPEQIEAAIVTPAIKGTLNMLEAAERTESVRRVVITSSVVAQISLDEYVNPASQGSRVRTETSRVPDPTGPYPTEIAAYFASKALALNTAERWMKEKPRHFSIVHVHPAFIIGRIELANTEEAMLQGSAGRVVAAMLGKAARKVPQASNTVWVEDIAEVHVRALDEKRIPNGQSLIVQWNNVEGVVWKDARDIVQKKFPKAVEKGILPNNGWPETAVVRFDVTETERMVGMKFEGFNRQIEDVAEQYLELVGAEKA